MIFTWIALGLALALLGLTIHVSMDLGQRSRRLRAEIEHLQQQVDGHNEELSLVHKRVDRTKAETANLLRDRDRLENEVIEQRRAVAALEDRLERSRPKSRRVDKADDDNDIFA